MAHKPAEGLAVVMRVEGNSVLMILIKPDGSITRAGDGKNPPKDPDIYYGPADLELLGQLDPFVERLSAHQPGVYTDTNQRGQSWELEVSVFREDTGGIKWVFQYGSKSVGPPPEATELVQRTIEATNGWYREQRRRVHRKPWWKLW